MNFFYGINNDLFKSEIQIPLFQNRYFSKTNLVLFKIYPKNKRWVLKRISDKKIKDYFYILKNQDILNHDIFFLADSNTINKFDEYTLKHYNNFTDTNPAFRANLKIYINDGGFSSYQSEYPFSMITKKGTILSSIYSLANSNADKNYVLIRNIFEKPIQKKFHAYFVNYKNKNVEKKFVIKTNYTNCIEISKKYITPEMFLVTDEFLGIPMYASKKNDYLSFEHTHPPHEYILSENKYLRVKNLKKEINEIIFKKTSK